MQSGATAAHNNTNLGETGLRASNVQALRGDWSKPDATGLAGALIDGNTAYYTFDTAATADPNGTGPHTDGIRAIRLSDGRRLWSVRLHTTLATIPSGDRGLAIAHGILYAAGDGNRGPAGVTAISLRTHKILWRALVSTPRLTWLDNTDVLSFAVDAGQVYVLADSGILDVFDARTGHRLWRHPRGGFGVIRPGVLAAGGKLFFETPGDSGLGVYLGRTGRLLWRTDRPLATYVATLAAGRIIFASSNDIFAYSAAGCGQAICAPLWHAIPAVVNSSAYVNGPFAISGADPHNVIVGYSWAFPGTFIEDFNATTGRLRWSAHFDTEFSGGTIARGGSLLYVIVNGSLVVLPVSCARACQPVTTTAFLPGTGDDPKLAVARNHILVQGSGSGLLDLTLPH